MSTYENEMLVTYRYCLCCVDFIHIISCDGPAERSQTVRLSAWGRLPAQAKEIIDATDVKGGLIVHLGCRRPIVH